MGTAARQEGGTARALPGAFGPVCIVVLLVFGALPVQPTPASAQTVAETEGALTGTWFIDTTASQFPREVGFGADFAPLPRPGDPTGTLRSPIPRALRPEGDSYDVAQRRELLNSEVRTPPTRLVVVDTADAVAITDDSGRSRMLRPDGRQDTVRFGAVSIPTVARREEASLVVLYALTDLRQLRYTYTRLETPTRLVVEARVIEGGFEGNPVRRVYTARPGGAQAGIRAANGAPGSAGAPPSVMPRAGSEFRGLTRLGLVVEDLGAQATGCGLTVSGLEDTVAKPFRDAGLRVSRNADEDTYIHVTVITSTLPNGMCITRHDWSIYSTADATLSHQQSPMLAQVVLAHKGGLSGSLPATHPADVSESMAPGLAQMAGIIRDANR